MSRWTLMCDGMPIEPPAVLDFAGSAIDMMGEEQVDAVFAFLDRAVPLSHLERNGSLTIWPVNPRHLIIGSDWSGPDALQLVEEGARPLTPGQVDWSLRLFSSLEDDARKSDGASNEG